MGLRCLAFAMITDLGIPGKIVTVTHEDVIRAATLIEPEMTKILIELLERLEFNLIKIDIHNLEFPSDSNLIFPLMKRNESKTDTNNTATDY
jgi:hypothetical protein